MQMNFSHSYMEIALAAHSVPPFLHPWLMASETLRSPILYITDQFCIGTAAYHELTMVPAGAGLPGSYLIKQCNESLNALTHMERTPGRAEGAQLNFYETLC